MEESDEFSRILRLISNPRRRVYCVELDFTLEEDELSLHIVNEATSLELYLSTPTEISYRRQLTITSFNYSRICLLTLTVVGGVYDRYSQMSKARFHGLMVSSFIS